MPLTERQHQVRSMGIGSSEIAAVVGEHPYRTPHDVWLKKLGLSDESVNEDAVWLGNMLEAPIAQWYGEVTGRQVRKHGRTVRAKASPIAVASPDYTVIAPDADTRLVEIKAVGWRVKHHWSELEADGVPPYVMLQCQWQMGVCEEERCDVAVCFLDGGPKRIYELHFEPELYANLVKLAEAFWGLVERHEPPPVDHTDSARRVLREVYGFNRTPLKPAPAEATEWALRRFEADKAIDNWEREKGLASNKLCELIGDAEGIEGEWGKATWKANKTGARVLRVTPRKEKAA